MIEEIKSDVKALRIGEKIAALRKGKGLSTARLAASSGLSEIIITQIESNTVSPSVAALLKIAKVFEKEVNYFFQDEGDNLTLEVVRRDEGKTVKRMRSSGKYALSYSYQSLSYRKMKKHMQPFLVEFEIDIHEDLELLTHEGEEFLHLLKGELELHIGKEVVTVLAGDSVYFDSNIPHGFVAKGKNKPKAVVIIYTPESKKS